MWQTRLALLSVLGVLLPASVGCAAATRGEPAAEGDDDSRNGSGIVIPMEKLASRTSVLYALQSSVSNLQVRRTGECPDIQIRGRKSIQLPAQPSIYVDGQHTQGTCILDMLNPEDVSRIEVYPTGVTNRPGYIGSAGGLILVFLKDGPQP